MTTLNSEAEIDEQLGGPSRATRLFSLISAPVIILMGCYGAASWLAAHRLESNNIAKCDNAIRATLKAPSTYVRISGAGDGVIEFDAQNSFGVPIRSSGICDVRDDGTVKWTDLSFS